MFEANSEEFGLEVLNNQEKSQSDEQKASFVTVRLLENSGQ